MTYRPAQRKTLLGLVGLALALCSCETPSGLRQPVFTNLFQQASCERFVDCNLFATQEACILGTDNGIDDEDEVPNCPCYDANAARDCIAALEEGGGSCSPTDVEVEYPEACTRVCCPDSCGDPACDILGEDGAARCDQIFLDLTGEMETLRDDLVATTEIGPECFTVPFLPTSHPDPSLEEKLPPADVALRAIYFSFAEMLQSPSSLDCGAKVDGVTLCNDLAVPPTGPAYVVAYETRDPMPFADPDDVYQIGFAFNADNIRENNFVPQTSFGNDYFQNSDRWYIADYSPSTGWRIEVFTAVDGEVISVPSLARYVLTGRAGALVVPASEIAAFDPEVRVSIFRHDGSLGLEMPNDWSGSVFPPPESPLARRTLRTPF